MGSCHADSVGRLIYMTSQSLRNYFEHQLKPYELTAEQLHVLKNVSAQTGVVQSELCEIVAKSPANVTRILDRLEKKKCVKRRSNPVDRRSTLVFLTGEGEILLQELAGLFAGLEQRLTEGIGGEQQRLLKDILGRINANIQLAAEEEKQKP